MLGRCDPTQGILRWILLIPELTDAGQHDHVVAGIGLVVDALPSAGADPLTAGDGRSIHNDVPGREKGRRPRADRTRAPSDSTSVACVGTGYVGAEDQNLPWYPRSLGVEPW